MTKGKITIEVIEQKITSDFVQKAKDYAIDCHNKVNHTYDGQPYSIHLNGVYNFAYQYQHLVDIDNRENFLAAAWCHDVIEDCRETYNDVLKATNKEVAELVYALTNEKGKTRDQRANDKYYSDMRLVKGAPLLKMCDRLANYNYSLMTNSRMADIYTNENDRFIGKMRNITFHNSKYNEVIYHLKNLREDFLENQKLLENHYQKLIILQQPYNT